MAVPPGRGKQINPVLPADAHAVIGLLAKRKRFGATPNEVARYLILRAIESGIETRRSQLCGAGAAAQRPRARRDGGLDHRQAESRRLRRNVFLATMKAIGVDQV